MFVSVSPEDVQNKNYENGFFAVHLLDDDTRATFEREWIGFLRLYNLMQFLPMGFCFTSSGLSKGINYEKIRGARDNKLHSIRIDQAYRGIVVKPDHGNVYVLLWVDHHDAAYAWAERRMCKINPETGSLQIFSVDEKEIKVKEEKKDTQRKGPFDDI